MVGLTAIAAEAVKMLINLLDGCRSSVIPDVFLEVDRQ
jgi:hypothetical protein